MTISDSIPIQFWLNGVETFNEKVVCGLAKQECFCQPFECDDELIIQFENAGYLENGDFNDDATQYTQSAIGGNRAQWELPTAQVTLDTSFPSASEVLKIANFLTEGISYNFNFSIVGTGTYTAGGGNALSVFLGFFDGSFTPLSGGQTILSATGSGASNSGVATITVPSGAVYFGIYVSAANISAGSYTISDIEISIVLPAHKLSVVDVNDDELRSIEFTAIGAGFYQASFTPSESSPAICEKIQIKILDPFDSLLAQSDCIDLKESHDCTKLISYTNSTDFDGIDYETGSPSPTFYLRIPAIFNEEDNPQTQEDSELSNGVIVTRRQTIQEKTLLETGYMPNYMHKKLQKILMHETVILNDPLTETPTQWKRRDPYESNPIKKYNLKRAEVLLTKYNSVERNTI